MLASYGLHSFIISRRSILVGAEGVLTVQRKTAEALVNRGSKNISECLAQASSIPPLIDASILSSRDILEICPAMKMSSINLD
ncbi:hypothetical protein NBRC3257_2952 [Gluconobacter thailandicus NBRC 3257]|uniref:Uncharacterized protein n=1 Tax=Gluconobacter thailandicus NBRC 3257 TaxID=1381097 RepID=A0ABQ0J0G7_GLUTH|nr:hypothetical protein NBRC3255_0428 [Gluconobacter thailandicus NBRC 3255]GAD27953.1 hypothetical protein NBRC3257_2952 [Gluconobacter thailandicus NBRC 3257]